MRVAIYCRVSREDQNLEQQSEQLMKYCREHGWQFEVFQEKISGAKESRPELDVMLQKIRAGEFQALLVIKLDRLGRSLKHLIQIVEELNNRKVQFICLNPDIDTKTSNGMFFLQIIGAVAQLERAMISERTKARLDYLKGQGKNIGRPKGSKDKGSRRKSGYWLRYAGKHHGDK